MNVVLIVCDTLRADHLGCYGYFRDTSPNLDVLASGGVQLEDFYSSGVCTGTAFTSIHTGLYPIHHKVYNVAPPELTLDGVPTLASILRREGFTTAAFDNLAYKIGTGLGTRSTAPGASRATSPTYPTRRTGTTWARGYGRTGTTSA